mmetsp:Transcript_8540/g.26801  ORF Transcript_8540/g.26801 Transcript_8540/m.26801 type:complete len:217 (-) Transcript_8540:1456-2106(-)
MVGEHHVAVADLVMLALVDHVVVARRKGAIGSRRVLMECQIAWPALEGDGEADRVDPSGGMLEVRTVERRGFAPHRRSRQTLAVGAVQHMAWRRRRADKLELLRADEGKDETEAPVLVVVVGGAPSKGEHAAVRRVAAVPHGRNARGKRLPCRQRADEHLSHRAPPGVSGGGRGNGEAGGGPSHALRSGRLQRWRALLLLPHVGLRVGFVQTRLQV